MNHLVNIVPRRPVERRHNIEDPRTSLSAGIQAIIDFYGGGPSQSGQRVTPMTAMQLPVVYACVRVLAESVASIPLVVYRRTGKGKERATEHPVYRVLHDRANADQPSFAWRETIMAHLSLRGNAFSEKEYDGAGRLIGLWPISPDRVTVARTNGVKVFQIDGVQRPLTAEQIMHVPGLGFDGLVGYSPLQMAREAIGLGLAAQEHGAKFFTNGANPGGVLEHPGRLGTDAINNLRVSWAERHGGSGNSHKPAILEEGMKWHQLSISNRDSQFLETRKFQSTDIAGIFRVPPHMVGNLDRATFSNIEQQSIDFVVHTLRPWCVRIEQVLNWELFDESEREEFFCEFNVEGLLRGDSAARGAFYTQMFNVGVLSVNDIREKENLNPVEGGDQRFVPLNMISLDKAGQPEPKPEAESEKKSPPKLADPKQYYDPDQEPNENERAMAAFQPMVRDVLERALFREMTAAKRAAKKGAAAFRAWIPEYETEQSEYLVRSLMPVMSGVAAMIDCRAVTDTDADFIHGLALAETRKAAAAYRSLEHPTEAVVGDMLDRVTASLDATAAIIVSRLVGAVTVTPEERKAA